MGNHIFPPYTANELLKKEKTIDDIMKDFIKPKPEVYPELRLSGSALPTSMGRNLRDPRCCSAVTGGSRRNEGYHSLSRITHYNTAKLKI